MSSPPVELIPLLCLKCQSPVDARVDEVAWACQVCGQGLLLGEDGGLRALEIFFSAALPQGVQGKPFWVAQGSAVLQRQTYSGNRSQEMQDFWKATRTFFIPAYELLLQEVVAAGTQLLRQPPALQPGGPAAFLPVVVPPGDVRPLAEFILLGIEAERKDALRTLTFELSLSEAQLWILP